jgi:hypothetical protein
VILSQRGEIEGAKVVYRLELEPRESWELRLDILASIDGDSVTPRTAERRFGEELTHGARVARSVAAARAADPGRLEQIGRLVLPVGLGPRLAADARHGRTGRMPRPGCRGS